MIIWHFGCTNNIFDVHFKGSLIIHIRWYNMHKPSFEHNMFLRWHINIIFFILTMALLKYTNLIKCTANELLFYQKCNQTLAVAPINCKNSFGINSSYLSF